MNNLDRRLNVVTTDHLRIKGSQMNLIDLIIEQATAALVQENSKEDLAQAVSTGDYGHIDFVEHIGAQFLNIGLAKVIQESICPTGENIEAEIPSEFLSDICELRNLVISQPDFQEKLFDMVVEINQEGELVRDMWCVGAIDAMETRYGLETQIINLIKQRIF
ncbi:hypothetical protein [Vibrio casei]|uniref:hypothetical protein n=1 Tax=Vibrio casei TaxID=673372 RepID=UPI000DA65460|nr:hypothetical protein [Vibrio casei]